MSFKMGAPFDGTVPPNDRVIIVDDVACDAGMVVNAIRHLNLNGNTVYGIYTLVERAEGNARAKVLAKNTKLYSLCHVSDNQIDSLIQLNTTLLAANNNNSLAR